MGAKLGTTVEMRSGTKEVKFRGLGGDCGIIISRLRETWTGR
jgi:hypothetical protein